MNLNDLRQKARDLHVYLFSPDLTEKGYDYWQQLEGFLQKKLNELENEEDELDLDVISEDEFEKDKPKKSQPEKKKESSKEEEIIIEEAKEKKKKKRQVTIPLSDGSYITVAPSSQTENCRLYDDTDSEVSRMQAILGSYSPETGDYQTMSQVGLSDIVQYVRSVASMDGSYVPVEVTVTRGEDTTVIYDEQNGKGTLSDYFSAYYQNTEVPEYSAVDRQIQYAVGAVRFDDGTHDSEFSVMEDENGNKRIQWTPPGNITSISSYVYSDMIEYAQRKFGGQYEATAAVPLTPTKYYDDMGYGTQPSHSTNSHPTSKAQMKMMDSGAGPQITADVLQTINSYRAEHSLTQFTYDNISQITYEEVASAPKEVRAAMAQAYVSSHAITYEDLQRVEAAEIGHIFEEKYAAQTQNAGVNAKSTWEAARQAYEDFRSGRGTGIDAVEEAKRTKYEYCEVQQQAAAAAAYPVYISFSSSDKASNIIVPAAKVRDYSASHVMNTVVKTDTDGTTVTPYYQVFIAQVEADASRYGAFYESKPINKTNNYTSGTFTPSQNTETSRDTERQCGSDRQYGKDRTRHEPAFGYDKAPAATTSSPVVEQILSKYKGYIDSATSPSGTHGSHRTTGYDVASYSSESNSPRSVRDGRLSSKGQARAAEMPSVAVVITRGMRRSVSVTSGYVFDNISCTSSKEHFSPPKGYVPSSRSNSPSLNEVSEATGSGNKPMPFSQRVRGAYVEGKQQTELNGDASSRAVRAGMGAVVHEIKTREFSSAAELGHRRSDSGNATSQRRERHSVLPAGIYGATQRDAENGSYEFASAKGGRAKGVGHDGTSLASTQAQGSRSRTASGVDVNEGTPRKVPVTPKQIGRARGLDITEGPNGKKTAGTKAADGQGRVARHVSRADKAIENGTVGQKSTHSVVPAALSVTTVNFSQETHRGKKQNTVLVLNSDNSGMISTCASGKTITAAFRGFASDMGRDNMSRTKGKNRRIAVAEAFERRRNIKNVVFQAADGNTYHIDREWLRHNSKNINSSLSKFRVAKSQIDLTAESIAELKEIINKAKKDGALFNETPFKDRKVITPKDIKGAKTKEERLINREQLGAYFANSQKMIKEAAKKSKKNGRREFWSATTAMVTIVPFLDNDMAAGLSVIRTFNRDIEIFARAGQKAALKQEDININKKFVRVLVSDGDIQFRKNVVIDGKGVHSENYKLGKNSNIINRAQQRLVLHKQIQSSGTLRRAGVDRLSVRSLGKILKEGKINGRILTDAEKATIFNIVLMKTARNGRLQDVNGVVFFNNKFKEIQLKGNSKGTYNFNKLRDINKALDELNKLSSNDGRFKKLLNDKNNISQLTDKELMKLLRKGNLTNAEKELVQATLALRAFKNEKSISAQAMKVFNSTKGAYRTVKQTFQNIVDGTDAGAGMILVTRYINRIKRAISMLKTSVKTLRAKRVNRLLKKYSKDKGIRGRINKTQLSQRNQARLNRRLEEGNWKNRTKKKLKDKIETKTQPHTDKLKNRVKGVRTKAALKLKNKFNNSALGKKFAKLRNSKFGKVATKVGHGSFRVVRGANKVGKGVLKGISFIQKVVNLKNAIIVALKKYAIIGMIGMVALTFVCTFMSAAYEAVTGFLYNNVGSELVESLKTGGIGGAWNTLFSHSDEDGDTTEYGNIPAQDTLVNDRIQYCIGMDSALREYIEGFYTNKDITDSVASSENTKLNEEDPNWYDPVTLKTFKGNFKDNKKKLGTTVKGINTGLHYTYYDGDGNIITMRSNAKDIVAVANTWIGTDLSAKGAYKTYVEKLWAYSHFVGYSVRKGLHGNFIYSCNVHEDGAECHNNIMLYYCTGKDNASKELYKNIDRVEGSAVHYGLDQQVTYNDTDGSFTINKTIGTSTSVPGNDENLKEKKNNVLAQNGGSSYKGGIGLDAEEGELHYHSGTDSEISVDDTDAENTVSSDKQVEYISLDVGVPAMGSAYVPQLGTMDMNYTTDGQSFSWRVDRRGGPPETKNDAGRTGVRDAIYNYLRGMGYNNAVACGILGNIYIECEFEPTNISRSGGRNYCGICQWCSAYTAGKKAYQYALNGGQLDEQLQLLYDTINGPALKNEYKNDYPTIAAALSTIPDTESGAILAAEAFCVLYENCPGDYSNGASYDKTSKAYTLWGTISAGTSYQDLGARKQTAKAYYGYFSGQATTPKVDKKENKDYEAPVAAGSLIFPDGTKDLSKWPVNAPYGAYSDGTPHPGIDIGAEGGTDFVSCSDGVVIAAFNDGGWHEGFGNVIVIESIIPIDGKDTTVRFLYGHNKEVSVKKGQQVRAGQVIGKVGTTGNSTGNHIHLETRVPDGNGGWGRVNPYFFISSGGKTVTYNGTKNHSGTNVKTGTDWPLASSKQTTNYDPSGDSVSSGSVSVEGGHYVPYSSGGTVKTSVDILYRTSPGSKYSYTEKGSWVWVKNKNGCERHEYEVTSACKPTGSDVTGVVLASFNDTYIDISTLGVDNSTTLHPNASVASLKFYNSSAGMCNECKKNKVVYSQYRNVNGMQIAEEHTAYYCINHLSDECKEKESKNKKITYYTKETCSPPLVGNGECQMSINGLAGLYNFYNKGSLTNSGNACNNKITKYHGSSDGIGAFTYFKGYNAKPRAPYCTNYSEKEIATGNTVRIPSTSVVTSYTEYYYHSSTGDFVRKEELSFSPNMSNYDHYNSSTGKYYRVEGGYDIYLERSSSTETTYTIYYEYKLIYTCLGHEHCLGHVVPKGSETVTVPYCTGYCTGHELKEYCTGHIDLDIGVVTLYADESATNNLINLGVAKNAEAEKTEYQAREENGRKTDDKIEVDTLTCNESTADKYLFTDNDNLKKHLSSYVFTEIDTDSGDGKLSNKFLLPSVNSNMKYEYIQNYGSFVKEDDIVGGLNFIKEFVNGKGNAAVENHSSITDENDYDNDNKITLHDIVAKAYASFSYEKFRDENDDWSVNYKGFINMPTVAKKNSKQVHFIGFYKYIIDNDGKTAHLAINNGEYVDTGNIARVHEALKEDWLQLYQISFPGAYNGKASDTEIQKLVFNIAAANFEATRKMGLEIPGHEYSEFSKNKYLFMDVLYKYPETYTKEITNPETGEVETVVAQKPRGTGLLSAWDEYDKEKSMDCLGKCYSGVGDSIDFALDWGQRILGEEGLNLTKGATKYKEIADTKDKNISFKDVFSVFNAMDLTAITEDKIPQWIADIYNGDSHKAAVKLRYAKTDGSLGLASIVKELKSSYLRKVLMMDEELFVNGASPDFNENGAAKVSEKFNEKLCELKAGDLVGVGDEVYLVLYQDSGIKDAKGYKDNGEPNYQGDKHGASKGKVYLLTVDNTNFEGVATENNEIHIFSYSLELLNIKRNSVWIYTPNE